MTLALGTLATLAALVNLALAALAALALAALVSAASSASISEIDFASASIESASTLARNFALYFKLRGLVLNLYPQQGHQSPSHLMNISQI